MTEIPEHLLKRSKERRAQASGGGGDAGSGGGGGDAGAAPEDPDKIPARLLTGEQGQAGGAATATATVARAGAAAGAGAGAAGPAGHTQRLLTVVKAGSIQDVKGVPTDKVHTWPHLLVG